MFTGIVERTGRIVSLIPSQQRQGAQAITQLVVDPGPGFDVALGDSVAVNGCCLTVTTPKAGILAFDVSGETLAKTALNTLQTGHEVNLERALRLSDRLGGHLVSGHIDGPAVVEKIQKHPEGWTLILAMPQSLGRYMVAKGSVCVDGVSLTVNQVSDIASSTQIHLMLIPTTVSLTTLKHLQPGSPVNIEVDLVAKYIERLSI